jgi:hypothetical protein
MNKVQYNYSFGQFKTKCLYVFKFSHKFGISIENLKLDDADLDHISKIYVGTEKIIEIIT